MPKAGGPNLIRRIIDIPAANAAPLVVTALGPCRGWRIWESILTAAGVATAGAEGFVVKIPNDGTAAGFQVAFGRPAYVSASEPGEFPSFENWNRISEHGAHGEVFAGAGGVSGSGIGTTAATPLFTISSLTNTGTSIELVEYY